MTQTQPQTEAEAGPAVELPSPPRPHGRRRRVVAALAAAVVLAAGATAVLDRGRLDQLWHSHSGANNGGSGVDNTAAVGTALVARQNLSAHAQLNGTLGYIGGYTVLARSPGTVTWLPVVGQVIAQGQPLYRVDGAAVELFYGSTPAYRDLAEGMRGADVSELKAGLVALGYATAAQIDPSSDYYGSGTAAAVERLQKQLGVTRDGTLHLGQLVFLPAALRVTALQADLGGQAGGPVLRGSSTRRQVVVNLDATRQSQVRAGDPVVLTLPDGRTTPGRVSKVGTVATASSSGGSSTVEVDITATDPDATGSLDQAPVQVQITTDTAADALVVPVNSLLALSGGGYAVEVVEPGGGRRLVPVTPGLFDDADGLVQVTDTQLRAGQRIVVAGS